MMTYVHPYDLFDALVYCEGVTLLDGAATYPLVMDLLSTDDEKFLYEECERIADGLKRRHHEW